MLFASREKFYSALWEDYRSYIKTAKVKDNDTDRSLESDISDCFYYRFIKHKKDIAAEEISFSKELLKEYAEKPKRDKYILLHGAYLAFKSKNITEDEYKDIFTSIIGNSKKNSRKFLLLLERNIGDANSQLEYFLLRGCVSDFFDNEGFKASGESFNSASRHRKEKQGYNDIIEMLYFYMREKNISEKTAERTAEISNDYIEKCFMLYNAAIQEKQTEAFIPLYFDSDSGAGIFIVGKDFFEDEEVISEDDEKIPYDCIVCIIYFLDFDFSGFTEKKSIKPIFDNVITLLMTVIPYKTVSDAFNAFSTEVASHKYFENYADRNDHDGRYFCPEGTDEIFIPRLIPKGERLRKPAEPTPREQKIMDIAEDEEKRNIANLKEKNLY